MANSLHATSTYICSSAAQKIGETCNRKGSVPKTKKSCKLRHRLPRNLDQQLNQNLGNGNPTLRMKSTLYSMRSWVKESRRRPYRRALERQTYHPTPIRSRKKRMATKTYNRSWALSVQLLRTMERKRKSIESFVSYSVRFLFNSLFITVEPLITHAFDNP
jgi:hypothetical protein